MYENTGPELHYPHFRFYTPNDPYTAELAHCVCSHASQYRIFMRCVQWWFTVLHARKQDLGMTHSLYCYWTWVGHVCRGSVDYVWCTSMCYMRRNLLARCRQVQLHAMATWLTAKHNRMWQQCVRWAILPSYHVSHPVKRSDWQGHWTVYSYLAT